MMIDTFIPLSKPHITNEDKQAVMDVLDSGMLVQGTHVSAFEKKVQTYCNTSHAIALSNGTSTMHLALLSLGVGKGDEVIVPAFSYVATANVVELVGAKPVFVDIDLSTFNIDVKKIEAAITPATKAIIPVHEFGLACEIEALMQIAHKHHLFVIEDAACALGAKYYEKSVGTFGDFGSFSLHPRKSITSGEGGVLITSHDTHASYVLSMRNHGLDASKTEMDFVAAGFNYRMTDIQAALVSNQFSKLDSIISSKQKMAQYYLEEINHIQITLPFVPAHLNHTWQSFHVLLDESMNQKDVIQFLKSKNIGSNYGAQCIPAMTYYKNKYNLSYKTDYTNAWIAYTQGLVLPLYFGMNNLQQEHIISTINRL